MPGVLHYLQQGDGVIRGVAGLLLAMSVLSWCLALGKAWMLARLRRRSRRAVEGFWHADSAPAGIAVLRRIDTEAVLAPLAQAAFAAAVPAVEAAGTLGGQVERGERVTRALRTALLAAQRRLEAGQTWLATIGSVAPFVGLLGTVWGIYHALLGIAASGQPSLADVAGPVGEALVMTALGLAVAIPAVVAYNLLGRQVRAQGEELDGFARDLHAWLSGAPLAPAVTAAPGAVAAAQGVPEADDGLR
ncbi:MotA/TolQ/ExbB proton channel family protein [Robbsia sp. Bb-Pol-6]|uniref:Biopolymer transport protein ExbB n=1 Tax=Robbsia betulipollinis TaxID=2981849 RepID=A0ABT3ZSK5_9BURK|nr:MotA/TolQ/ExbB proton channel family protein [Robbsia betulipollinis]MCY0388878.1 MotA/TolQ/ExbB proton channel family protein [Robbsia betulipollinis]